MHDIHGHSPVETLLLNTHLQFFIKKYYFVTTQISTILNLNFQISILFCSSLALFLLKSDPGSSSGVARGEQGGGSCPRAPPGGGRQNPVKEF